VATLQQNNMRLAISAIIVFLNTSYKYITAWNLLLSYYNKQGPDQRYRRSGPKIDLVGVVSLNNKQHQLLGLLAMLLICTSSWRYQDDRFLRIEILQKFQRKSMVSEWLRYTY
jgi:hypothetical protein